MASRLFSGTEVLGKRPLLELRPKSLLGLIVNMSTSRVPPVQKCWIFFVR